MNGHVVTAPDRVCTEVRLPCHRSTADSVKVAGVAGGQDSWLTSDWDWHAAGRVVV